MATAVITGRSQVAAGDESSANSSGDGCAGTRCCSHVPRPRRRPRPGCRRAGPRHVDVPVEPLHERGRGRDDRDRGQRRSRRLPLLVAQPQDQERHDHRSAAHAEEPAEEPPAVPIVGEPPASAPAMARTTAVPTRRHAQRGARGAGLAARRPRRRRSCSTSTGRSRRSSATPTTRRSPRPRASADRQSRGATAASPA